MATCPYCRRYTRLKQQMLDHINQYHGDRLEADKMDAAQALYYSTHGSLSSKCQCGCGRDTKWNALTGKPYKVSDDPSCRERLRKLAVQNHVKVYGKETLLDDMEHQREMQKHRPTAGEYKFSDGGKVGYLSKPELGFLKFCDTIMDFSSNMIQVSPETFTYYDPKAKVNRKYDPDFYLPDYNLLVEIKDGGDHTNMNPAFVEETKYKVALKDEVMRKQTKYNFIKIVDSNFGPFVELLYQITHVQSDEGMKIPKKTMIVITESACKDIDEEVDFSVDHEEMKPTAYLVVGKMRGVNMMTSIGISESPGCERIYLTDFTTATLRETDRDDPIFQNADISVYRYCGEKEPLKEFMRVVMQLSLSRNTDSLWNILDLMTSFKIFYAEKSGIANNPQKKMDFIKEAGDTK